jgi:hypothetical protein
MAGPFPSLRPQQASSSMEDVRKGNGLASKEERVGWAGCIQCCAEQLQHRSRSHALATTHTPLHLSSSCFAMALTDDFALKASCAWGCAWAFATFAMPQAYRDLHFPPETGATAMMVR